MKPQFKILAICILFANSLFAQSTITGLVIDDKKEGVFFATVALYNQDSTIAKANTTEEDGSFVLQNIKEGNYYLKTIMLGFEDSDPIPLSFPDDDKKVINLTLANNAILLNEVVVSSKVPLIEQRSDRLVVNIENSKIASGGSFLDALENVPGMIVTNGSARMAGQSNLTILIDGRSTKYMNIESLLQDMPADNIKQIEVIHQPGAEFDAEGSGPVINIILKKSRQLGFNGRAAFRMEKDYKWLNMGGLSLNYYNKGLNINTYLAYSDKALQESLDVTRKVKDDVYTQSSFNPNDAKVKGVNLSVDWDISDKQRVGIGSQLWSSNTDQVKTSTTGIDYFDNNLEDINLTTRDNQDGELSYYSLNPYYTISFDTTAHKLDLEVNLFNRKSDTENRLTSISTGVLFPGQRFDQIGDNDIKAAKLDYSKPLSESVRLDMGFKYSDAHLENDLGVYKEMSDGSWLEDTNQSNLFIFDESIKAVYAKIDASIGDWKGTVGLRYEDSYSLGESAGLEKKLDRRINKLFPSFSIQRPIGGPIATSFAYSYRINRPSYTSLNPFTTNFDPFTGIKGNPTLVPSLAHSMKLNLLWDNYPFFNFEYQLIDDPMVQVTEQNDDTGETFRKTVNFDQQRSFNVQTFVPLEFIFDKVGGYFGGSVNYNEFDSRYLDEDFFRNKWTYSVFLRGGFNLPGKIQTIVAGSYVSGILDGLVDIDHFYRVEVSLRKKFLDNKLSVGVGIDDVFYRFNSGNIKFANMDINFQESWYVNEINFNIAYSFGNRYLKEKKARVSAAQEEIGRTREKKKN